MVDQWEALSDPNIILEITGEHTCGLFKNTHDYGLTIHGELQKGTYCTLLMCRTLSFNYSINGTCKSQITADIFIKGDHLNDLHRNNYIRCHIKLDGLHKLVSHTPLRYSTSNEGLHIRYHHPLSQETYIKKINSTLDFLYHIDYQDNEWSANIKAIPYLKLESRERQSINWFIEKSNMLSKLFTLLAGFYLKCISLSVETHPESLDVIHKPNTLQIFNKDLFENDTNSSGPYKPALLKYEQLYPHMEQIGNNWVSASKRLASAIDLFYQSLNSNAQPKWIFMNLTFALENIHDNIFDGEYASKNEYRITSKRIYEYLDNNIQNQELLEILKNKLAFGNKYTLKDKVLELLGCAGNIIQKYNIDIETFAQHVSKTRNALAHGRKVDIKQDNLTCDLTTTNLILKGIIGYYLLKELKIDDAIIEKTYKDSPEYPYY